MKLTKNGLMCFDYQFPIYNYFFPNQHKNITTKTLQQTYSTSNENIRSRALYFHIPFCETICSFCHFTRGGYKDHNDVDRYTKALIKEIELKAKMVDYHAVPVRAIFFGGGTPSILSAENIRAIGAAIHRHFDLSKLEEFSFEIEVKSLNDDKISALQDIGVTHPRFGLQTFSPLWRKLFNLTSTMEQIQYAARALNAAFSHVSFDIIYGMNGQDEEDIISDLEQAIALGTTNIDIYPINNVSTQPKLHKHIKDTNLGVTSATRKFTMNILIDAYMRSRGFMPHNGHGYVRCNNITSDVVTTDYKFIYHEHVYGYADHDLHGFGVNAASSLREHAVTNTSGREKYINAIENNEVSCTISQHPSYMDEMKPLILHLAYFSSLEKSKVRMETIPTSLMERIAELKNEDLITEDAEYFRLTKKGWYWYTNIMYYLMPDVDKDIMKSYIHKQLSTPGKFISKKELIFTTVQ